MWSCTFMADTIVYNDHPPGRDLNEAGVQDSNLMKSYAAIEVHSYTSTPSLVWNKTRSVDTAR